MYVYLQNCCSAFSIVELPMPDGRACRRLLLRLHRMHTEEFDGTPHSRTEKKGRSLMRWALAERQNVEG